jgi:YD repeat-containing protein
VTDPLGLTTTYNYNGIGDLTSIVSPDTGTTTL